MTRVIQNFEYIHSGGPSNIKYGIAVFGSYESVQPYNIEYDRYKMTNFPVNSKLCS